MNAADIGRCSKRIVQYIWDPEPRNDREPHEPIWCLGVKYLPAEGPEASQTKTRKPTRNHMVPNKQNKIEETQRKNAPAS